MKMLKNICFIAVAALGLFASCDTDAEGTLYNSENAGLKFMQAAADFTLQKEDNSVSVRLARSSKSGELTVALSAVTVTEKGDTISNQLPEGITIPASVTFADGQGSVDIKIAVGGNVALGAKNIISVSFADKSLAAAVSPKSSCAVSIMKDYDWKPFGGIVTNNSEWMEEQYEVEALCATSPDGKAVYKFVDLFQKGYDVVVKENADGFYDCEKQAAWTHSSYGVASVESDVKKPGQMKDGVLSIILEHTVSAGSFGSYLEEFTFQKN